MAGHRRISSRGLIASLALLGALSAGARPARAAGPAYLVKDLTSGAEPGIASDPRGFVDLGGVVLFAARDDSHGVELWRTDGQPDGTALVADLAPGAADGVRGDARAVIGGVLYFSGPGGIWRSDGTAAGTRPVTDIDAADMVADGAILYAFSHANVLWRIATADGAVTRLGDFPDSQITPSLTLVGDRLFFTASRAVEELWTSDGTPAGTRLVRAAQLSNREGGNELTQLFAVGAQLFFVAYDDAGWELWRSDGTTTGTARVRDIHPGPGNGLHFNDYWEAPQPFFAALGDTLLFMADDGESGLELWRSDGTEAGTRRVADLAAGALGLDGTYGDDDSSDVAQRTIQMLPAAGRLFFTARPSGVALELWESDGNPSGTRLVAQLTSDWGEVQSAAAGAVLYLSTQSGESGVRLWTSDGTASGSVPLAVPYAYAVGLTPALGGVIFAAATDHSSGTEPWASDGTAVGTRQLADIARGRPGLDPSALTDLGGTLLFSARDGERGYELWRSDGTDAGTALVADIASGAASSDPRGLVASGATLYFSADDGVHGRELWRSDGTDAGTALVADIAPDADGDPQSLVADGHGGVYFFASQPASGYELWHSDGTDAGTRRVREINPGGDGSLVSFGQAPLLLGDTLLFSATDDRFGAELWRSDGTEAGTALVADLRAGENGSYPLGLARLNDAALFLASEQFGSTSLWRTDGAAAGTTRLARVGQLLAAPAVGSDGRVLFTAHGSSYDDPTTRLWQSDGTAAGTFTIDTHRIDRATVAAAGSGLFALISGGVNELYRLDCGALLESSDPLADLVGLGDRLLLSELVGAGGRRLWTSDGTRAGTVVVEELPGPLPDGRFRAPVVPAFTRAGDLVFFAGEHGGSGRELWALPIAALPVADAPPCPPPTPRPTPAPYDCPDGGARCTVLALDAVTGEAGDAVTITATLHATDVPIAGIQNDITFPDRITVAARADGSPDCAVDPGIDKPATAFAFQPPGCTPGASCAGLRALVLAVTNVDPIPDGAALYTCTLRIPPDAHPRRYPLALSNLGAADPDGFAVPLTGVDGQVEVREQSGTRPSASASGGSAGCQTAPPSEPTTALPLLLLALCSMRRRRRECACTD